MFVRIISSQRPTNPPREKGLKRIFKLKKVYTVVNNLTFCMCETPCFLSVEVVNEFHTKAVVLCILF